MKFRLLGLSLLAVVVLVLCPPRTLAQAMPGDAPQVVPYAPDRGGTGRGHRWSLFGRFRGGAPAANSPAGLPSRSGTNPAGTSGLPRGRRYYNGRYFGSFNNRFYSPQYGYF